MSGRGGVASRLSTVGREIIDALAVGVLEGYFGGLLLLGMIAGTLVVMLIVAVGVVILYILSLLLFFSSAAQAVVEAATDLFVFAGFLVVPVGSAVVGFGLLSLPDGELTVDPSGWAHPVVIPLVGFVVVAPFTGIVLPPWPGLLDRVVAGTLAGMMLYRGSLYPLMLDDSRNNRYLSNPVQRRVDDALPDGTLVGQMAFALGLGWLAAAVTISIVGFVSTDLVVPLEGLPLFPPSPTTIIGVPLLLGVGQVATYGCREATIVVLDHRRWLGRQSAAAVTRCRAAGSTVARLTAITTNRVKRTVEYVVLLRP